MPSSHSATMLGLTTGCLLTHSAGSGEFAIAVFLSMVVMYDAMGVRLETGQQAKILNRMRERDIAEGREPLFDKPLDEQMGHTLAEVIVGVIIGITVGIIMRKHGHLVPDWRIPCLPPVRYSVAVPVII